MIDNLHLEQFANINPLDLRIELFRKRDFSFIVEGENEDGKKVAHEKQRQALEILTANLYKEFLFGGAAGGSKSWTGCTWILFMALCYPHTKYFIARNELKDILDSVYVTWNKVCRTYGFKYETDWKFNAQKNYIQLANGSHINLIELKYKPSDPMYEDVGSTEYTAGWIEEVGEIHEMAATVIASRVGRHLNKRDHNGNLREKPIKGIVFYTGNPKKNWTKRDFYDKWKKNKLEAHKRYLGCLVTDNPFIESEYIENLQNLANKNKAIYERLFKGNWDYEDNEDALCSYEMIERVFDNDHVAEGSKYITADVARFGSDKAVIGVWSGWQLIDVRTFDISKTTDQEYLIRLLRRKYQIPKNRCIADQDGVGGGVVDGAGIIGFTNNARPIKEKGKKDQPNYKNIQVQCLYHLSDKVNQGAIWINADLSYQEKEHIMEELDQIQSKNSDERKLECKSKSDIKQDIGRSPDYRDMLLMRVYFDLKDRKPKFMRSRERKVV